jgi:mRNA interferase RelE/StbE
LLAADVAAAAVEFITGPLLEAPYRVGRPLRDTLSGFHSARLGTQWRVLYRIDESKHAVIVQDIQHRSSAYRRIIEMERKRLRLEAESSAESSNGGS